MNRQCARSWRVRKVTRIAAILYAMALLSASALKPAATARAIFRPASVAASAVLYDGGLGTTPGQQGWFYQQSGGASETFAAGATTLDTTASKSILAGYFASEASSPALVPVLDRASGYRLTFIVQVQQEDHAGSDKNNDQIDDRAGFSVIALSSDKQGIELGFWTDRIWAQEGGSAPKLFTQAEGAAFNTAAGLTRYDLTLQGDTYWLSSGCVTILSGKIRDYTASSGPINPYTTPNFLFFGDDTSSASARMQISQVQVATGTGAAPNLAACVYLPMVKR